MLKKSCIPHQLHVEQARESIYVPWTHYFHFYFVDNTNKKGEGTSAEEDVFQESLLQKSYDHGDPYEGTDLYGGNDPYGGESRDSSDIDMQSDSEMGNEDGRYLIHVILIYLILIFIMKKNILLLSLSSFLCCMEFIATF